MREFSPDSPAREGEGGRRDGSGADAARMAMKERAH
jgi:hypothetical protein